MKVHTVTSLSGGKSSAYMWLHYPTDHCLFSLVLTEDPATAPKDKGILREVQNRIPGFIGTTELEQTLANVLRLEEYAGNPIDWVCAYEGQSESRYMSDRVNWSPRPLTFERLAISKRVLPDKSKRFCTEQLKVQAIFWHLYLNIFESDEDMAIMAIGYRHGEEQRWAKLQGCEHNRAKFPSSCNIQTKKQEWRSLDYRVPACPMIEDKVDHLDVLKFWAEMGWVFPFVSNCAHCFYHDDSELQHIYDRHPAVIDWAIGLEQKVGATFDSKRSLKQRTAVQQGLIFENKEFACFCSD